MDRRSVIVCGGSLNNNSIKLFILCAASTAKRPITDTTQQI
jgi:hypothetical protein